jgi:cation diffusion facilitator CzcD-associated flavoprotein CzcO
VDVIICATGYDTSFVPRFPIIGSQGRNLQEKWKKEPASYFGVGVADFPNFMMLLGPYSPVANGPTMAAIGRQRFVDIGIRIDPEQRLKMTISCG